MTVHEIVVGMDGSAGAAAALRWAVAEGRYRDRPVVAVLAWGFLDQHHPGGGRHFDPAYDATWAAGALEANVEAAVGAEAAGTVRRHVVNDLPTRALLERSEGAELLVVGARGLGGFRALLLGSVSDQALHHATCPVAVVRDATAGEDGAADGAGPEHRTGPVVVGVDGSPAAAGALHWAIAEARAREVPLVAVHAWQPVFSGAEGLAPLAADVEALEASADRLLEQALAAEDTAGLTVRPVQSCAGPAAALLDAAAEASVLVVGSRGQGGFAGLLLGSVSQHVTRHAPCPTIVVPAAADPRGADPRGADAAAQPRTSTGRP